MRTGLRVWAILAVVSLWVGPGLAAVIYTQPFNGPGLPPELTYTSSPPITWSVVGGQLVADFDGSAGTTVYATTTTGYIAPGGYRSVYSLDVGAPVGSSSGAFNVGLAFGGYVALFHPGYTPIPGAFRMEGGYSQGNTDMGYVPALGALQHVVADVTDLGSALAVKITVTGMGTDSLVHTFDYSFFDTSPNLSPGTFGARWTGGGNSLSDGLFDNFQFETQPVPEPSVAALLGSGLLGGLLLLWRRNKRFWP